MKRSNNKEFIRLANKYRNIFYKSAMTIEEYTDLLEKEVFSDKRFISNIKETSDSLNLEYDLVYSVIRKLIIFIASKIILFHGKRLRINLCGFIYFDCLNPLFEQKSNQFIIKQLKKNN